MIIHFLIASGITFINLEGAIAYWRYHAGLSCAATFLAEGIIVSCFVVFWLWFSEKVLGLTAKRCNIYEKYKHKKFITRLKAWGPLSIYICGAIPSLTFFLTGLSIQKMFVQTKLGCLCLWLGAITRLTISVFIGFKLLESLIKSIF